MGDRHFLGPELSKGLAALHLELDASVQLALLKYLDLLSKWNRVYNLTAVRSKPAMLRRHLLDSLTLFVHVHGSRVLDVGTGAGLPGIPLAITLPDKDFTLLDASAKRCRFLTQVRAELGLQNVRIAQMRIEDYRSDGKFDTLASRAYTRLADFVNTAGHLLADDGRLIAMKGMWPGDEPEELTSGFAIDSVIKTNVPGLRESRHLVICKKTGST